MNMKPSLPGVEVIKTDLIPEDNAHHAGEHAANLRAATGGEAWGFGKTEEDAVSDALAALAEDL